MSKKVLITGYDGQLSWELVHHEAVKKYSVTPLTIHELDITKPTQIQQVVHQYSPDLIINTAAYTAVDKAEIEMDTAQQVNVFGIKLLAETCAQHNIPLIHYSTDYIFSGEKQLPYVETDFVSPINYYGDTKWQGEELLRQHLKQHIILRVSSTFGVHGNNFVKAILNHARQKTVLEVVADQVACPTPAVDIADVTWKLVAQLFNNMTTFTWGTYHYCAPEAISWYDFACAIVEIAKRYQPLTVEKIIPITAKKLNRPAKRPTNSVLNCEKIHKTFNIKQIPWQIALKKAIRTLLA